MGRLRELLSHYGPMARNLVAVVAVIGLGYGIYRSIPSFDADLVVRPVWEEIEPLTSTEEHKAWWTQDRSRLMGVELYALNPVSDVHVRFTGLKRVHKWGLFSDAFEPRVRTQLLDGLPVGDVPASVVLPSMPTLIGKSRTILLAIADVQPDFDHRSDWFTVSASNATVSHCRLPTVYPAREWPWITLDDLYKPMAILLLCSTIALFLWLRSARKTIKQLQTSKESRNKDVVDVSSVNVGDD